MNVTIYVKYVDFMIYRNAQFIHLDRFGDTKGHHGTLLLFCIIVQDILGYYLLSRQLSYPALWNMPQVLKAS